MPAVQANGITIEYEVRGEGEPLLLVMGLGGQLTDWPEGFVDLLAERYQVILFDNRDSGLSTEFEWTPPPRWKAAISFLTRRRPKAGYLLDDMADDAAALLDALDVDAAHVVGMSMGGMIAQLMAVHHPHKVLSLASVMSNTGDQRRGLPSRQVMAAFARAKEPARDDAAQASVDSFRLFAGSSWDPEAHLQTATRSVARSWRPRGTERQATAIAASGDRTELLGRITAPTVVIHGLEDQLVKPDGGTATCSAIPGSRLLMFPDMGHDLPSTRWAEMLVAIAANAARAGVRV